MSISTQSQNNLRSAIAEMSKHYVTEESKVTDFHFHVNNSNGVVTIFDDDDNELSHARVSEWEHIKEEIDVDTIEKEIRNILSEELDKGTFDNMNVPKPYSCILIDDDKETIVDLLYIDNDTYIIDDGLLKGLDEELNDFLRKLLEE
ncbi:MAG: hypothetical protein IKA41_06595 [Bacteroidaceae bacterium]|nr:hypothetical protein [Bacteroidaceae bacterium]